MIDYCPPAIQHMYLLKNIVDQSSKYVWWCHHRSTFLHRKSKRTRSSRQVLRLSAIGLPFHWAFLWSCSKLGALTERSKLRNQFEARLGWSQGISGANKWLRSRAAALRGVSLQLLLEIMEWSLPWLPVRKLLNYQRVCRQHSYNSVFCRCVKWAMLKTSVAWLLFRVSLSNIGNMRKYVIHCYSPASKNGQQIVF